MYACGAAATTAAVQPAAHLCRTAPHSGWGHSGGGYAFMHLYMESYGRMGDLAMQLLNTLAISTST